MVNLIMEEEVVTELIQGEFNVANLTVELNSILNPTGRERQKYGETAGGSARGGKADDVEDGLGGVKDGGGSGETKED